MSNKNAIYAFTVGEYGSLKEPLVKTEGWDYILYTDNKELKSDIWDTVSYTHLTLPTKA